MSRQRSYDDRDELRRSLGFAPVLESLDERDLEAGPGWELGRVGVVKGYPGFETSDMPGDLMPDAALRKIPFDYPDESFRGFAVVLAYAREGDHVHEVIAGWVPPDRERQLDEWITFLNREIQVGHAAEAARRARYGR